MFKHKTALSSLILMFVCFSAQSAKTQEEVLPLIVADQVASQPIKKCPSDMVEVEGDYCPNVVQDCLNLDKTVHNANGYVRCLEFAPSKCLSKTRTHMHFCMDKYEWPNKEGEKPAVMVSWNDMKKNCENIGKRLCVDKEWTMACEGNDMLPYPYGYKRDPEACNIDHPQRQGFDATKFKGTPEEVAWLDQRVASGAMPACVSPYGVHDMTGNVDESVVNSNHGQPLDPSHPEGKKQYWSAEMGGHWVLGARARCRPKTTVHDEATVFYEIGGRCCADIE